MATKSGLTLVENEIPDVNGFVKLSNYISEITKIKNDYVTNTALTSRTNDLKNQHVACEVKKVDDKVKKNTADILSIKSSLDQEKSTIDDLKREASFNRGFYCYNQQPYFLFE